jgi:hypothetical protein
MTLVRSPARWTSRIKDYLDGLPLSRIIAERRTKTKAGVLIYMSVSAFPGPSCVCCEYLPDPPTWYDITNFIKRTPTGWLKISRRTTSMRQGFYCLSLCK